MVAASTVPLTKISLYFMLSLLRDDPTVNVPSAMKHHWAYTGVEGPDTWRTHYPLCAGSHQSPIDIHTVECEYDPSLDDFRLTNFHQLSTSVGVGSLLNFTNNGHAASVRVTGDMAVEGGGLPGRYLTAEFHFHWGRSSELGSEHAVDGVKFPLEIHVVNYAEKHGTLAKAMDQPDGLAVLGVVFELSEHDNPAYAPLADALQYIHKAGAYQLVEGVRLRSLLPADTSRYWRYSGSLTTPRCYESVTWTLFAEPQKISERQVSQLRHLLHEIGHDGNDVASKDNSPSHLVDNWRPLQPLNGRVVRRSFAMSPKIPFQLPSTSVDQTSAQLGSYAAGSSLMPGDPTVAAHSSTQKPDLTTKRENKPLGDVLQPDPVTSSGSGLPVSSHTSSTQLAVSSTSAMLLTSRMTSATSTPTPASSVPTPSQFVTELPTTGVIAQTGLPTEIIPEAGAGQQQAVTNHPDTTTTRSQNGQEQQQPDRGGLGHTQQPDTSTQLKTIWPHQTGTTTQKTSQGWEWSRQSADTTHSPGLTGSDKNGVPPPRVPSFKSLTEIKDASDQNILLSGANRPPSSGKEMAVQSTSTMQQPGFGSSGSSTFQPTRAPVTLSRSQLIELSNRLKQFLAVRKQQQDHSSTVSQSPSQQPYTTAGWQQQNYHQPHPQQRQLQIQHHHHHQQVQQGRQASTTLQPQDSALIQLLQSLRSNLYNATSAQVDNGSNSAVMTSGAARLRTQSYPVYSTQQSIQQIRPDTALAATNIPQVFLHRYTQPVRIRRPFYDQYYHTTG